MQNTSLSTTKSIKIEVPEKFKASAFTSLLKEIESLRTQIQDPETQVILEFNNLNVVSSMVLGVVSKIVHLDNKKKIIIQGAGKSLQAQLKLAGFSSYLMYQD